MSNPHFEQVVAALDMVAEANPPGSFELAYMAIHAQAQLAVAYELQTKNLIAFEQGQWAAFQNGDLTAEGQRIWAETAKQIQERLGIL